MLQKEELIRKDKNNIILDTWKKVGSDKNGTYISVYSQITFFSSSPAFGTCPREGGGRESGKFNTFCLTGLPLEFIPGGVRE